MNEDLLETEMFGLQFSRSGFLKKELPIICKDAKSDTEKAITVYEHLKNSVKWNEKYGILAQESIRDAYTKKSGNVGQINLLLTAALKRLGLDAEPVVLSTRDHGLIKPAHPSKTQFNYVVTSLLIDSVQYLLDATEKLCPFGTLPTRCINGRGRVISDKRANWLNLYDCPDYKTRVMYDLTIQDDGKITGSRMDLREDYAALYFRNNIRQETDVENYLKKEEEKNLGLNILNHSFSEVDNIYKPIKTKYDIEISEQTTMAGDLLYFNPMVYEALQENPFKLEDRKFPVDYAYAIKNKYIFKINIPEGYNIESLPEGGMFSLPNKDARFVYSVSKIKNAISLNVMFSINKSVFGASEYKGLKEFYNQIISLQSQQVVLKKI